MPGLDWLRGCAALAVVALHAGIPYVTHPLPALRWCVLADAPSAAVDTLVWAIDGCVMPLFFLMGGCLAGGAARRYSHRDFLYLRSWRLLAPFVLACLLVLPADLYIWLLGWIADGLIPLKKLRSIKLPSALSGQFWGVAHLWYLQELWCLTIATWAVSQVGRRLVRRIRRSAAAEDLPSWSFACLHPVRRRGLIVCTLSAGLLLAWEPEILIGFRQRWFPSAAMLGFYGCFFGAGWTWPRSPHFVTDRTGAAANLIRAALLFPVLCILIHAHVQTPLHGALLFALTTAFSLFGWLTATSLFSLAASRSQAATPGPVRFLAEASFWMYLVHHPFVGLTQVALMRTSLGPDARFAVAFSMGLWLSLSTYAVFVRRTRLAQLLGVRVTAPIRQRRSLPDEANGVRRAA